MRSLASLAKGRVGAGPARSGRGIGFARMQALEGFRTRFIGRVTRLLHMRYRMIQIAAGM